MKILLSWEAYNHDFENESPVLTGPNGRFHQLHFEKQRFDKHILLSARGDPKDCEIPGMLVKRIQHTFPSHNIELKVLPILDVIDINEIKIVIHSFLQELKDHELYFFVSPATPAMQVVWHLLHIELAGWRTHLLQTRRSSDTKTKTSELVFIELEKSSIPTSLIQKEATESKPFLQADDEVYIGESLKSVYQDAQKVAVAGKIHVLIQGPTGSGKEHLARFVHESSARKSKPMLTINCSAFDDNLLLSELFGHEKGAFTGADKKKTGLFEEAHGGTIFLDEIGDISPFTQQALLRVVQSGEIRPLSSTKTMTVDVRIITATHKDLKSLCSKEKFRWDLYYRLSTATLELPSLMERGKDEIEEYLNFIIKQVSEQLRKSLIKLSKEVKNHLLQYHYPGNLREMHNIISTLYVFYEDGVVDDFKRLPRLENLYKGSNSLNYEEAEAPFMRSHIKKIMQHTRGNITKAAEVIGWAPNTLRKNADKVGIDLSKA